MTLLMTTLHTCDWAPCIYHGAVVTLFPAIHIDLIANQDKLREESTESYLRSVDLFEAATGPSNWSKSHFMYSSLECSSQEDNYIMEMPPRPLLFCAGASPQRRGQPGNSKQVSMHCSTTFCSED